MQAQPLFLIEFYTYVGDINFAWVFSSDKRTACDKLSAAQGKRMDCIITCSEASHISPLAGDFKVNTTDANLFILH